MDKITNLQGLSQKEAESLLGQYGFNRIEEKRESLFKKLLKWLVSPISLMLLAAAGLSFVVHHIFDVYFILSILILNVGITFWHENKADKAIETLRKRLAVQVKTLRSGKWETLNSVYLVPGDIVELTVGDLVPADMEIKDAVNIAINEAVLTGESMPRDKKAGDTAYSGSVVVSGLLHGKITTTGNKTYFGKIVRLTETGPKRSTLERDIISISKYLIYIGLTAVAILTPILIFLEKKDLIGVLLLDLSLLIASLPVSMPTVMTLIVSVGALILSQKNALTRRLASLEDLANVNLLLTDKTGTLTKAEITVSKISAYHPFVVNDVIRFAAAASLNEKSLIDRAISLKAKTIGEFGKAKIISFIPADSIRKRSTVLAEIGGIKYLVSDGAATIIESLSKVTAAEKKSYEKDIEAATAAGDRVIAVAVKENPKGQEEKGMKLAGLLVLSDLLRKEAPSVIKFLESEGISVKMMTGDIRTTAGKVSEELGLTGGVLSCREMGKEKAYDTGLIDRTAAFAEMLPEDKLKIVQSAKNRWTVAVTGDGVNDLPAIKAADVGIAVQNAVDALKGSADIVLLSAGISVVMDALIEARKIFTRLYTYSLYRLSESLRLIITVLVLGLLYADYPLTPIQLILLALLNDIPIISLSFNRVKNIMRPAEMKPRNRFILGSFFGLVGVANSLIMFFLLLKIFHFPWPIIQTAFFLKLTVSGHMLIYVAHTKERWYKFFPSSSVIWATSVTQGIVTAFALFGIFVIAIPWQLVIFVWLWAFFWMQISESIKLLPIGIYK